MKTKKVVCAHLHFYNESGHLRFQHSASSPRKTEYKHARPLLAKKGGLLIQRSCKMYKAKLSPLSAKNVSVGMNENVSFAFYDRDAGGVCYGDELVFRF